MPEKDIHERYERIIRKDPTHVVLENGEINGYALNFAQDIHESRINEERIKQEEFVKITKNNNHYEVHLLKYGEDDGKVRKIYTEGTLTNEEVGNDIRNLKEGESRNLYLSGRNYQ